VRVLFVAVLVLGFMSWPWVFLRYLQDVKIKGNPNPTGSERRGAAMGATLNSAWSVARWFALVITWPARRAARGGRHG